MEHTQKMSLCMPVVHRYIAVSQPLQMRVWETRVSVHVLSVMIMLLSGLLNVPIFVYEHTCEPCILFDSYDEQPHWCYETGYTPRLLPFATYHLLPFVSWLSVDRNVRCFGADKQTSIY
jgi:hypothetical protein